MSKRALNTRLIGMIDGPDENAKEDPSARGTPSAARPVVELGYTSEGCSQAKERAWPMPVWRASCRSWQAAHGIERVRSGRIRSIYARNVHLGS